MNHFHSQEAKEKIEVVVEYEPEVSVEEMFIHAKDGDNVELVCVVHARPKAEVRYAHREKKPFHILMEMQIRARIDTQVQVGPYGCL